MPDPTRPTGTPRPSSPAPDAHGFGRPAAGWRRTLYVIIFEADTPAGKAFDLGLLAVILVSVGVVMLDSIQAVSERHATVLVTLEWLFTLVFTVEYVARLACVDRPMRYARSFFGIVDLVSIAPTYLAILFPELHALIDVRLLRLLRVFRILKLTAYIREYSLLGAALWATRRKILVFLATVMMIVVLLGSVMYIVEGPANGFTSIPVSVYWAITTMTTVGFGDITPRTDLGRLVASVMMLLGWGTLAVPTGIVTAEIAFRRDPFGAAPGSVPPPHLDGPAVGPATEPSPPTCGDCGCTDHLAQALYCQRCGALLR